MVIAGLVPLYAQTTVLTLGDRRVLIGILVKDDVTGLIYVRKGCQLQNAVS